MIILIHHHHHPYHHHHYYHHQDKVNDVDTIMIQHRGCEQTLITRLQEKYKEPVISIVDI